MSFCGEILCLFPRVSGADEKDPFPEDIPDVERSPPLSGTLHSGPFSRERGEWDKWGMTVSLRFLVLWAKLQWGCRVLARGCEGRQAGQASSWGSFFPCSSFLQGPRGLLGPKGPPGPPGPPVSSVTSWPMCPHCGPRNPLTS